MLGGVSAGLARRAGTSPTVVRLLFVVSLLLPGPQFLVYLGLWLAMPVEPRLGPGGDPARLPAS